LRFDRQLSQLARFAAKAAFVAVGCASPEEKMADAQRLLRAGDVDESLALVREVIADDPGHARANLLLARVLLQQGKPSTAVWPLERSSRETETALEATLALAQIHVRLANHRDAILAAERVLALERDHPLGLELLARAQLGARLLEQALATTQRLRETAPDAPDAALLHGAVLEQLGRVDEAEALYRAQLEWDSGSELQARLALFRLHRDQSSPAQAESALAALLDAYPSAPAAIRLGLAYYDETARDDDAIALLERAIASDPARTELRVDVAGRLRAAGREDDAEAVLRAGVERFPAPESFYALADHLALRGRFDEALAWIDRALEVSDHEALRFRRGEILSASGRFDEAARVGRSLHDPLHASLLLGRVALDAGDPVLALEQLDVAVRLWPNNARARYLAGRAALASGDPDRAASEWREAHRADPEMGEAVESLVVLLASRGRPEEALLFAARHPRPQDPGALLARAHALHAAGREAAAIAALREVVRLDPDHAAALNDLAWLLAQSQESLDEALLLAGKAVALAESANFVDTLGWVQLQRGELEPAERAFRGALALDPDSPAAAYHLALVLERSGDARGAMSYAERALAAEPFPEADGARVLMRRLAAGAAD
jgi:tetratricopeptide (TPR) repeat protein